MGEAHLHYEAFQRALGENLGSLVRLAQSHSTGTLAHLDAMMRGLLGGPHSRAQIAWLVEADRVIRRTLGGRQREADLAILRGAYRHCALHLILGAGISQGAGLPGWKDLVVRILDYALCLGSAERREQLPDNLSDDLAFAPETLASEIRELKPILPDLRRAMSEVRDALQQAVNYTSAQLLVASQAASEALGRHFPRALQSVLYGRGTKSSRALNAIPSLVRQSSGDYGRTARLSAILTYNFDDLVEATLASAGIGSTAHACVAGKWSHMRGWASKLPSAVDIYHVHGYAPYAPVDLGEVEFVLTEQHFAKTYARKEGFARSVQNLHLTTSLGLILGSSLSDEYALEELRIAHAQNPGWFNYVMMSAADPRTREQYAELGLRVLWFKDHEEIAQLLEQIGLNEAAGE